MKLTICILAAMALVAVGYIVGRIETRRERAGTAYCGWMEDLGGWRDAEKSPPKLPGKYIVIADAGDGPERPVRLTGWLIWREGRWEMPGGRKPPRVLYWIGDPMSKNGDRT